MTVENSVNFVEQARNTIELLRTFGNRQSWRESLIAILPQTEERRAIAEMLFSRLQDAVKGIGRCVDERPTRLVMKDDQIIKEQKTIQEEDKKPGAPGGSAFFTVMFMMFGKEFDEAINLTQTLHQRLNWDMTIHIDDHGTDGELNENELRNKLTGCGFLGVWREAAAATISLLGSQSDFFDLQQIEQMNRHAFQIAGDEFTRKLGELGATIVVLTDKHSQNPKVVINCVQGKTLAWGELYGELDPFEHGLADIASQQVLDVFNELAGTKLSKQSFENLQVVMYLATVSLLGGIGRDFKNVFVLDPQVENAQAR